jgi:hypothetical protein
MSVIDKVSKSKPKEVIHKESIEDENKNETNGSNVTSVNNDGKEESDDDSTIEEDVAMSGVDDSKHHENAGDDESDKECDLSSSYNIPDDLKSCCSSSP